MQRLIQAFGFVLVCCVASAIGQTISPSGGGSSVCGSNTQIQYNNSGACGASANLTYDGTSFASPRMTPSDLQDPSGFFRAHTSFGFNVAGKGYGFSEVTWLNGVANGNASDYLYAGSTSGSGVTNRDFAGRAFRPNVTAIADLPAAPVTGMIAAVNDALAPAWGVNVAATGAAYALVTYNGSNWTVIGK